MSSSKPHTFKLTNNVQVAFNSKINKAARKLNMFYIGRAIFLQGA